MTRHKRPRKPRHRRPPHRPPSRPIEPRSGAVDDCDRFLGRPWIGKREDSEAFGRELL